MSTPNPPLERATMVFRLHTWGDGHSLIVALDPATGGYRSVPLRLTTRPDWMPADYPADSTIKLFALSPDGTGLLVDAPSPAGGKFHLLRFPDQFVRISLGPGDGWTTAHVHAAAFAPDGTQVAALAQVGDRVEVTVHDLDDGGHRELWRTDGGAQTITWSPDGRYLGVTYINPGEAPDDTFQSVVLDTDGVVVADHPEMEICGHSRLCWVGEHELVLAHELWEGDGSPPLVLADPATGNRREIRERSRGGVVGVLDGRILLQAGGADGTGTHIDVATYDGSPPLPLVPPFPGQDVGFFDAVPGLFDTLA